MQYIGDKFGFEVDEDIVQTNTVKRTGKDKDYRMQKEHQPTFYGKVEAGWEYILIDDAITMGATFGALNKYIKNNGGQVVDTVVIGAAQFSTNLALNSKTLYNLISKYSLQDIIQAMKERGLYDEKTTQNAAAGRTGQNADAAGDRGIETGQEAGSGVRTQEVSGTERKGADTVNEERATQNVSEIAYLTEAQARKLTKILNYLKITPLQNDNTGKNTYQKNLELLKQQNPSLKFSTDATDAVFSYVLPEHKKALDEALKKLSRQLFGDEKVFTYDKFVDARGRVIGGFSYKDIIAIAAKKDKSQAEWKFYHEAMHKAINLFLTSQERQRLY